MISYILQLLEMEEKKIAVLIGSVQAAVASLLALLQLPYHKAFPGTKEATLFTCNRKPRRISKYGTGKNQ